MRLGLLVINAGWSAVTHVLSRGSLVVVSMILARHFDTSSFAAYGYFQLTASMFAAYASLGMGVSASRFFAEANIPNTKKIPPLGTLWIISIIIGLFFALFVLLLPDSLVRGGLNVPKWMLAMAVFVLSLGTVPGGGILGLEQYKQAAVISIATMLVLISGSLVAANLQNVTVAMLVFIVGNLIQVVGCSYVIIKIIGRKKIFDSITYRKHQLLKIASYAGPMIGVSILSASGSWSVGKIILHSEAGPDAFALYTIGLQWFGLALFFPGMVSRVVLPRFVRMQSDGSDELARKALATRSVLATLGLAIFVGFSGVLLSPWLIAFYGESIGINTWLIAVFSLAAIPAAPANTLGNSIIANNGQLTWLFITIAWFLVLILTAYLSVSMSASAGAIAQGVSACFLSGIAYCFAKNKRLI